MKLLFNIRTLQFILIITMGLLMTTPFQNFSIISNLFLTISFLIIFSIFLLFENVRIQFINKWYLVVLLSFPLIYSFRANYLFNQSIFSGLSSSFSFFGYTVIIYLYYFFRFNENPLLLIEKSVVRLGWLSLIFLLLFKILFSELSFSVISIDGLRQYDFDAGKVSSYFFIPWLGYIYLAKFKLTSNSRYFILSSLFLSYPIFFFNARSYTIVLLLTLFIAYISEFNKNQKIRYNIILFFVILTTIFVFLSYNPFNIFLSNKINSFSSIFGGLYGLIGDDNSVNFRIYQFQDIINYIGQYFFLGAGLLSQETTKLYISEYLFPTDLGLFGLIFNFGLVGLLVIAFQLKYFYSFSKFKIKSTNSLILGSYFYLISHYIGSLFNGAIAYKITAIFMLMGIVILGVNSLTKKKLNG